MVGWCIGISKHAVTTAGLRDVADLVDGESLCDESLIKLVMWISHYYQDACWRSL